MWFLSVIIASALDDWITDYFATKQLCYHLIWSIWRHLFNILKLGNVKQEFALFSHNLRLGKCLTLRKSKGHFVCSWRCDRCRCRRRRRRCWRFRCCRQSIKRTSSSTSLLWFLFFAMLLFLLPRLLFILAHFYALCTAHCAAICCLPLFLCRLSSTIVFVFVFIILFFRYCGLPSAVCWPLNLIPTYLANKINLPQLVWAQCQGQLGFSSV